MTVGRRNLVGAVVMVFLAIGAVCSPVVAVADEGSQRWQALSRSSVPGVAHVLELISAGSYEEAAEAGDFLADRHPDEPDAARAAALAAWYLGAERLNAGDAAEAVRWCERAAAHDPSDPRPRHWLGLSLVKAGRSGEAEGAFRAALDLREDPKVLESLARLYRDQDEPGRAIPVYRRALEAGPPSRESLGGLAWCLWKTGELTEARELAERARALAPEDPWIVRLVARLSREGAVEEDFDSHEQGGFSVAFERTGEQRDVKNRVLALLPDALATVERALWRHEGDGIGVVLYGSGEQYHEALEAPAWGSGQWDGKIRLRVETARDASDERLTITLRHELVHLLVGQRYRSMAGRIPAWVNEGLAMAFDGRDPGACRQYLRARVARSDWEARTTPFGDLDASFGSIADPEQAHGAYAQALYAVLFLQDRHRPSAPTDLLDAMLEGDTAEEALRSVTGKDYAGFRTAWRAWLCEEFHLGGR